MLIHQNRATMRQAFWSRFTIPDPASIRSISQRVFDPFYTTKDSGIGMGLSICRSIIAAHGGRLWADANQPRGAVFQFTLPAAQQNS